MFVLLFLDASQSVVALLKFISDEIDTFGNVLLTIVERLLHQDWAHDFIDLKELIDCLKHLHAGFRYYDSPCFCLLKVYSIHQARSYFHSADHREVVFVEPSLNNLQFTVKIMNICFFFNLMNKIGKVKGKDIPF